MQLANSKIFNNRNIYRDKSEVKSGIEIVDPIFKDFITSQQEPKKLYYVVPHIWVFPIQNKEYKRKHVIIIILSLKFLINA